LFATGNVHYELDPRYDSDFEEPSDRQLIGSHRDLELVRAPADRQKEGVNENVADQPANSVQKPVAAVEETKTFSR